MMVQMVQHSEASKIRLLNRFRGRSTAYEVVLTDGETVYGLGYSARHSRYGLVDVLRSEWDNIAPVVGKMIWNFKGSNLVCKAWTVKFTGRTHRDAISSGHYPYLE